MAKNDLPVENRLAATGAGGGRRGQDARRGQGRHMHDRCRMPWGARTGAWWVPRRVGWAERGRGHPGRRGRVFPMADPCWCVAETNTTLSSNYSSIKNKLKTTSPSTWLCGRAPSFVTGRVRFPFPWASSVSLVTESIGQWKLCCVLSTSWSENGMCFYLFVGALSLGACCQGSHMPWGTMLRGSPVIPGGETAGRGPGTAPRGTLAPACSSFPSPFWLQSLDTPASWALLSQNRPTEPASSFWPTETMI